MQDLSLASSTGWVRGTMTMTATRRTKTKFMTEEESSKMLAPLRSFCIKWFINQQIYFVDILFWVEPRVLFRVCLSLLYRFAGKTVSPSGTPPLDDGGGARERSCLADWLTKLNARKWLLVHIAPRLRNQLHHTTTSSTRSNVSSSSSSTTNISDKKRQGIPGQIQIFLTNISNFFFWDRKCWLSHTKRGERLLEKYINVVHTAIAD